MSLPAEFFEPPSDFRSGVRATMIGKGFAPHYADECADLAVLAVSDALAAIQRTTARASGFGAELTSLSIALSAMQALCAKKYALLVDVNREIGSVAVEARVSLGGGQ